MGAAVIKTPIKPCRTVRRPARTRALRPDFGIRAHPRQDPERI